MDLVIDNFGEIDRLKWENIIKEKSIVAKYNKKQTAPQIAYVKFLKTVIEFTFNKVDVMFKLEYFKTIPNIIFFYDF